MNLNFKDVTNDNYNEVINLTVSKSQEHFIESNKACLDEASELDFWKTKAIYDDNTLIGFTMYGLFKDEGTNGRVWLDRFMIGEKHQGKGYGIESVKFLIKKLYKEYNCNKIYLSVYDDNFNAIKLYKKIGFNFNGELDINGEKVMEI